ncbi:hypothetical protein K437DRAFT_268520 [Tilletiaria anomala UBC 951]|uniref:Uncharacterized protein n=1 Tax=Tilletiaria anomala (strain ATCC 24038 / CBS 436.72 / UBC 951) TaxID=1037660 RepID=A0A066W2F2_TILAU|nr:uncharacterized protein K437DRAFT_268520 [Tilletiaria anomala UBC 951]KDN45259.1 hypothetical protein K437DRAFT_268520 [Tilletiaria anomala UBC 951]
MATTTPDPDMEEWLTLRLRAYVGPSPAAQHQEVLPTIDPESLFTASLLKEAFPRKSSTPELDKAEERTEYPAWVLDLLPARSHHGPTLVSSIASNGLIHPSSNTEEDSLNSKQALLSFLKPHIPAQAAPKEAAIGATASKCIALQAYLERELAPLVLHYLYVLDENFKQITVPAYVEAHLNAAAAELKSDEKYGRNAKEELGWLARRQAVQAGRKQAQELRSRVQPALIRAGLWQLTSASDPGTGVDSPWVADSAGSLHGDMEVDASFSTRGGALHGIAAARAQRGGSGLGVGDFQKTKEAFRMVKLESRAKHVLSTVAAFYAAQQQHDGGRGTTFVNSSETPTTSDLLMFALLAPVLYPPRSRAASGSDFESSRWPQPYLANLLLFAGAGAGQRIEEEQRGAREVASVRTIVQVVEAVRARLWPDGNNSSNGVGPEGISWANAELSAQAAFRATALRARASTTRNAIDTDEKPVSVASFALLLAHGLREQINASLSAVAAPFRSTPIAPSSFSSATAPASGQGNTPFNNQGEKPTPSASAAPSGSSPPARQVAEIRRRRLWWMTGSAFAIIGFLFASEIVSVEFTDDDEDEEEDEREEDQAIHGDEKGMIFAQELTDDGQEEEEMELDAKDYEDNYEEFELREAFDAEAGAEDNLDD